MSKKVLTCLLLAGSVLRGYGQTEARKMTAVRVEHPPAIDGLLNDEAWKSAQPATDFIELRPVPGRHEKHGTEVRIVYDNTAIYIGARMYDDPDSIAHEIVERDQVGNSDFIGIIFDTYFDKLNGNGFYVTAAGSQYDAKYSNSGNEDDSWNAVWLSKVHIDEKGWTAEMKIPYSALRFAKKDIQVWGVNMTRRRQKIQQQTFWSFVDPKKSGFVNQEGELNGISNIQPPLRLSFSPYISGYVNNYPYNTPGLKNTTQQFNGGMDLKYGINQAFTLDMTLVPDFGQVQSDDRVLNLSPFETQYNEKRAFFTEGTELFSKGDLFYSRRIGSTPLNYSAAGNNLKPGETVISNPSETRLLNATKVSGRSEKGLGIGFFNAVTRRSDAIIRDASGNERLFETQPLTNYNILVLDQSLKNNSYVTVINTNVLRKGSAYDANASGLLFSLNDKKNKYNVKGSGRMTYLNDKPGNTGYSYDFAAGKQSGTFTFDFSQELVDDKFNPNDLGILNNNNFFNNSASFQYSIYKPGKWYNQYQTWANFNYSQRYKPMTYQSVNYNVGAYVQFKNLNSVDVNLNMNPESNDFYEARFPGRVFRESADKNFNINASTNRSKKYNAGFGLGYVKRERFDGHAFDFSFYQNYRISDKLALGNDLYYGPSVNSAGWIARGGPDLIIFSRRNRKTVENSLDAKYAFNPNMGITAVLRHYWSSLENKQFYTLTNDGNLTPNSTYTNANADRTFDTFNIDLVYSWVFLPGSELSVVYKDASSYDVALSKRGYFTNFDLVTEAPQNNSLSVKLLYYIDYLQLKKNKKARM